ASIALLGFDKHVGYHAVWPLTVIFAATSVTGILWSLREVVDRPIAELMTLPGAPRVGSHLEALVRARGAALPFVLLYHLDVIAFLPVMEEVLFRAFAYAPASRRLGHFPAALFTAFLWSLMHQFTVFNFLSTVCLGFIYAHLYRRTESLLPS